jgi:hypothetical protein
VVDEAGVPTPRESTSASLNSTSEAVPKPKEVLAVAPDSVTKFVPSPTIKLLSVGVNPAMSDNCASKA